MTNRSTVRVASVACLSIVTLVLAAPLAVGQDAIPRLPLRLRAFAINMSGNTPATKTGTVDITIERLSTESQGDRLLDALITKGSDTLLRALQDIKPRAGFVKTSQSLAWDIGYARITPGEDGGYRLTFATDRPISFWEARTRPRTIDYEFMLCEVHMPKTGAGQGKLAPMAKLAFDKKTHKIEIENYDIEPIRLSEIQVVK